MIGHANSDPVALDNAHCLQACRRAIDQACKLAIGQRVIIENERDTIGEIQRRIL
jgi:hypothetical protein